MSSVESLKVVVGMYRALGGEKYAKHIEEFYIPFAKHVELEVAMIERAPISKENGNLLSTANFDGSLDRPPPFKASCSQSTLVDQQSSAEPLNLRKRIRTADSESVPKRPRLD